jgi:hypothetical protein
MKLYKYMHPDRTEWLHGGKFPLCQVQVRQLSF